MCIVNGMTGDELKRIRQRLKFTQVQFAEHIGVTSNTVARWERDEVTITEPMVRLIRLLTKPAIRPDASTRNADWPKRTRDVDTPVQRKGGRKHAKTK